MSSYGTYCDVLNFLLVTTRSSGHKIILDVHCPCNWCAQQYCTADCHVSRPCLSLNEMPPNPGLPRSVLSDMLLTAMDALYELEETHLLATVSHGTTLSHNSDRNECWLLQFFGTLPPFI